MYQGVTYAALALTGSAAAVVAVAGSASAAHFDGSVGGVGSDVVLLWKMCLNLTCSGERFVLLDVRGRRSFHDGDQLEIYMCLSDLCVSATMQVAGHKSLVHETNQVSRVR